MKIYMQKTIVRDETGACYLCTENFKENERVLGHSSTRSCCNDKVHCLVHENCFKSMPDKHKRKCPTCKKKITPAIKKFNEGLYFKESLIGIGKSILISALIIGAGGPPALATGILNLAISWHAIGLCFRRPNSNEKL